MAIAFTEIENEGDFYSSHYLSAVLEGDLKSLFERWRKRKEDEGLRTPPEILAGLANRYFTAYGRAAGERDEAERLALSRAFHAHLLEALGYSRDPRLESLDGDEVLPLHLALRRDGNPFLWVIDAPFPAGEREDEDPLAGAPLPEQMPDDGSGAMISRRRARPSA